LSVLADENLILPGTEGPKFTEPQDIVMSKSTRHLLFSELPNFTYNTSGGYEVDIIPEVQDLTGRTTSESTDREMSICDPNPCQNGGECERLDSDGFQCHCPATYSGTVCSNPEEVRGKPQTFRRYRDARQLIPIIIYVFRTQIGCVQRTFVRSVKKIESIPQVQSGNGIQKLFGRRDSVVRPTATGRVWRFHIDSNSQ